MRTGPYPIRARGGEEEDAAYLLSSSERNEGNKTDRSPDSNNSLMAIRPASR